MGRVEKLLKNRNKEIINLAWLYLRGARTYFSTLSFVFHLKDYHTKDLNFKILVKLVEPFGCDKQFCILQLRISLLCKVHYG